MRAVSRARALLPGVGVVLAMAAAAWVWRTPVGAPAPAELRGSNVLLVTIDTLRADRLSAYGGTAGLTPTLDTLAARGATFTRTWSHAPITLPAHASILTGLLPPRHGVRNNGSYRLGPQPATLAERLHAAGYRTGAFVGAFVLDARFGLNRGFEEYDDRYEDARAPGSFRFAERTADRVLRAATQWITQPRAGDARPWFAWIHLFDPHTPYRAPAPFSSGRSPYDAEVAWTDAQLGAALEALRDAGQIDRTLIVITADHGESLGEHGETTHGLFAYDATLRVPLIIAGPGVAPSTIDAPTSHVDILPTILDLTGVPPAAGVDGRSWRTDRESRAEAPPPIYFETLDASLTRGWAPLTGIVRGRWKYIDLPRPELYDLVADPAERTNVVAREPREVHALQASLRARAAAPGSPAHVDAPDAARLRSLGYVAGAAAPKAGFSEADDPKQLVALNESFNTALEEFGAGRADAAFARLDAIVAARPDFRAARLSAATVLIALGRSGDAVDLLRAAPEVDRRGPDWLTKMGQALAAAGALREARPMLAAASTMASGDPEPLNELGVVLLRLGEREEARRAFERLLKIDVTAAGTWYNLGLLEMSAGRRDRAADAFRRVVELDPRHVDGWRGLGAALAASDTAGAVRAWRAAVDLAPQDFDTLFNLGILLADQGRGAESVPYLRRFLAEAPRDRYHQDVPRVRAALARAEAQP